MPVHSEKIEFVGTVSIDGSPQRDVLCCMLRWIRGPGGHTRAEQNEGQPHRKQDWPIVSRTFYQAAPPYGDGDGSCGWCLGWGVGGERLDPAIVLHVTSSLLRLALPAVNLSQCEICLPGERTILLQFDHSFQRVLGRIWITDGRRSAQGV